MYAIEEISTGKIVVTLDPLTLSLYSQLGRNSTFLEGTEPEMESARATMEQPALFHVIISPKVH